MPGPLDALKKAQSIAPSPYEQWFTDHPILGGIAKLISPGVTPDPADIGVTDVAGAAMPLAGAGLALKGLKGLKTGEALAMDEASRMGRAAEQGFTNPMYHGTRADFTEFDPAISDLGIHVTPRADTANTAVNTTMTKGSNGRFGPGARIMPLQVKMDQTLDTRDVGLWTSPSHWVNTYGSADKNYAGVPFRIRPGYEQSTNDPETIKAIYELALKDIQANNGGPSSTFASDVRDLLRKAGYDSLQYSNFTEGAGEPSFMVLDPRNIRSKFAAFNPAMAGKTRNIMASGAPLLGLKALFSNKDEQ